MSDNNSQLRLLVKTRPGVPGARLQMDDAKFRFSAAPLFKSIGVKRARTAAAPAATWQILTPIADQGLADPAEVGNPWDLCHHLLENGLGVPGGDTVEFAEPDLQQRWLVGRPGALAVALAAAGSGPDPQNPDYPTLPDDFWYRDQKHGQWNAALATLSDPGDGKRTRIAHLDTGYDPTHLTRPRHLNTKLQKNFVDSSRPDDASDDSGGLLNNLGHGTGTLSILAGAGIAGINGGSPFGCAPDAEIVPIRVANRVVLFYNSAIAKAFDHVHGLCADPATFVHVITMSMGGLPSQAWAEAVDELYEAGVFIVTAAGNNYANAPTHDIVWPARFSRVVAACGVMANQKPYADLPPTLMAGDYGPDSKMKTAIAAYTPNTPWARFGAPGIVDFDGNGPSAATPPVAAAAALWIQKNRAAYDRYPQAWMRVEAVRKALFDSARVDAQFADHFGRGKLAALDALAAPPAKAADLRDLKQALDSVNFPIFSLLTGLGIAPAGPQRGMLELEALQVVASSRFETPLPGAPANGQPIDARAASRFAEELQSKPGLSKALRAALGGGAGSTRAPPALDPSRAAAAAQMNLMHLAMATKPPTPTPPARRLRVYAYDPSLSTDLANFGVNDATIAIRWEDKLKPGPVGEYLEIVDVDPASGTCYAPVDLTHPHLLAENGLAPSEANPQFHQQMCYAVAMRTIEHFEQALGRTAMWSSRYVRDPQGNVTSEHYVPRLRIYPHALRTANSFYSSDRKALLLGYFRAKATQAGNTLGRTDPSSARHRTTSSRTKPLTPSWTASTAVIRKRPTRTCSRFTKRSPTSSPCFSTSACRRRSLPRSGKRAAISERTTSSPSWRCSSVRRRPAAIRRCVMHSASGRIGAIMRPAPSRTPAARSWSRPSLRLSSVSTGRGGRTWSGWQRAAPESCRRETSRTISPNG
jgi:hypothetical protein